DGAAGVVPSSGFRTGSAAAGAAWIGERASVGLAVSRLDSRYGVPGHAYPSDEHGAAEPDDVHDAEHEGHDADARIELEQTRVVLRAVRVGLARLPGIEVRLGMVALRDVELEGAAAGTLVDSEAYEGRVEVLHAPWGAWQGAFGAQLGERKLSAA